MRKVKYTPEQLKALVEKQEVRELPIFYKKYVSLYSKIYGSELGWSQNLWGNGIQNEVSQTRTFEVILGLPVEEMPKDLIGCVREVYQELDR